MTKKGFFFETAPDMEYTDADHYVGPPKVDPKTGDILCKNGKKPDEDGKCPTDDDEHAPEIPDDKRMLRLGGKSPVQEWQTVIAHPDGSYTHTFGISKEEGQSLKSDGSLRGMMLSDTYLKLAAQGLAEEQIMSKFDEVENEFTLVEEEKKADNKSKPEIHRKPIIRKKTSQGDVYVKLGGKWHKAGEGVHEELTYCYKDQEIKITEDNEEILKAHFYLTEMFPIDKEIKLSPTKTGLVYEGKIVNVTLEGNIIVEVAGKEVSFRLDPFNRGTLTGQINEEKNSWVVSDVVKLPETVVPKPKVVNFLQNFEMMNVTGKFSLKEDANRGVDISLTEAMEIGNKRVVELKKKEEGFAEPNSSVTETKKSEQTIKSYYKDHMNPKVWG